MAQRFSTLAVLGLGTSGSAFAEAAARAGHRVIGVDTDEAALHRARARLLDAGPGTVVLGSRLREVAAADLVVEAVPERLDVKSDVLRRADGVCGPETVFATTTTGLSVTEIAFRAGRPERTAGLHLFPPQRAGRPTTVEVVSTAVTDGSLPGELRDLVHGLGYTPVGVADRPGFVGGALTMAYLNSAAAMVDQGYASCADIDAAMRLGCGLPMGPLAQLDAIGLDTARDTLEALYERTGERRYLPAPVLVHRAAAGLLGRKTGRGFHDCTGVHGAEGAADAGGERTGGAAPELRGVRSIGIVGSGTMATGIAEVCVRSGYPTIVAARGEARAKELHGAVERSLNRGASRGKLAPGLVAPSLERLSGAVGLEGLAGCDVVIEAVVEDISVKRAVFAGLDAVCGPDAVLATTTSSLPVIECAMATRRPEAVVGTHFFNPAPVMRLVEVAHTVLTSPGTLGTVRALTAALGKHAVSCRDRTGFIVNALLFPYLNSAVEMLEEGRAGGEDIDTVMAVGQGYPLGPLELLDVIGLDVSLAIQRTLHHTFKEPYLAPARPLEQLVQAGHLGRKGGKGLRRPMP